ncbi:hypothetical protein N658DRAFT_67157 [Parathielavia hyrcaniae]|uniref:Uncharacterized protein n=1 Tax=Parathielavia hyrcaniae TaxID=113614 RepID=A0AAN6T223_9PEZI|nr:hypothetical protein N658DRAFT_67157 [Parathielavia hyrcaniae]
MPTASPRAIGPQVPRPLAALAALDFLSCSMRATKSVCVQPANHHAPAVVRTRSDSKDPGGCGMERRGAALRLLNPRQKGTKPALDLPVMVCPLSALHSWR